MYARLIDSTISKIENMLFGSQILLINMGPETFKKFENRLIDALIVRTLDSKGGVEDETFY